MIDRKLPDINLLRQLLALDEDTGTLFWKKRDPAVFKSPVFAATWNARYAGREAFTARNSDGYKVGRLLDVPVRAHVVIYALYTGGWPDAEIDHRNGDRTDNRPINLRRATRTDNMRNRAKDKRNISGVCGVYSTPSGRWAARIGLKSKMKHLGTFDTFAQARAARFAAEDQLGYAKEHGKR